ncbi:MAG: ABC-type transport auxiliary lipoprotein family protein [Spirochaetaceae bacterium]
MIPTLNRNVRTVLLLVTVVFLSSCSVFPARETFYYALEYSAPEAPAEPSVPGVVRVMEPRISTAYNRRQIVLRDGTPRFQYLTDDMWAVDLIDTLQEFVERYYNDAGAFESAIREFDPGAADYELYSFIRRVEFLCCDTPEARVEVVFELRQPGGAVLLRDELRRDEALPADDLVAFARGVNELLLASVMEFDARVREALGGQ